MEEIWVLWRDPPASEIIAAYTSLNAAIEMAYQMDPGCQMFVTEDGEQYESGLWRVGKIELYRG
jgi:hypothetical protein